MKNIFNKIHIGQKVSSRMYGNGVIIMFDTDKEFPVVVENIKDGEISTFSACGRSYKSHVHPSLEFGHREANSYNCGTPEIVLEPLVMEDRSVLAYVSDVSLEEAMRNKRRRIVLCKKSYDGRLDSQYLTIRTDSDTDSAFFVSNYKYAVEIPDSDKIIL